MREEIQEGAVGSDLVTAIQRTVSDDQSEGQEDVMTGVVRRQEAALRRLEAKHGSGYGKPPPGSESEARARKYNENCVRSVFVGSVRSSRNARICPFVRSSERFMLVLSSQSSSFWLRSPSCSLSSFSSPFYQNSEHTLYTTDGAYNTSSCSKMTCFYRQGNY